MGRAVQQIIDFVLELDKLKARRKVHTDLPVPEAVGRECVIRAGRAMAA